MTLGSSAWLPGHHRAPLLLSTRDELFSVALGPPPFGAGPCAWPNLAQGLPGPAAEASRAESPGSTWVFGSLLLETVSGSPRFPGFVQNELAPATLSRHTSGLWARPL